MPAITGFDDIPSNFEVDDFLLTSVGSTATCLTDEGEGKLRFLCAGAHLSYNDPIIYPGQEGAAHLHNFFGNDATDHNSTYASLRTTGGGTCAGGPINRTGYWFPAMIKPAGPGFPIPKVVKPAWIEMYYHNVPSDLDEYDSPNEAYPWITPGMVPFPNGLQMVFGWKHDHPIPPPPLVWARDNVAIGVARQGTLKDVYRLTNHFNTPHPVTGVFENITARIVSPACWDGINLVLPGGRAHLADDFQDGAGHLMCPNGFYKIPRLTVIIAWSNNGPEDWRHWYLSVDRHTGHNLNGGHGFHTDWFGAWDSGVQTIWEEEHLAFGTTTAENAAKTSVSGILCRDDLQLDPAGTLAGTIPNGYGSYYLPEASRYADIPAMPGQKRLRLNLSAAA